MNKRPIDIFDDVVSRLVAQFPAIRGEYTDPSPAVDRAFEMRKQQGLVTDVLLNLQNEDELHLCIGPHFWCEWFPCKRAEVVEEYFDAVSGFIAGRHRVVDFYRGDGCSKSLLQRADNGAWKTLASSSHLGGGGWPWSRRRQHEIRNREQVAAGQPATTPRVGD
jgi:hypothetical protein